MLPINVSRDMPTLLNHQLLTTLPISYDIFRQKTIIVYQYFYIAMANIILDKTAHSTLKL